MRASSFEYEFVYIYLVGSYMTNFRSIRLATVHCNTKVVVGVRFHHSHPRSTEPPSEPRLVSAQLCFSKSIYMTHLIEILAMNLFAVSGSTRQR